MDEVGLDGFDETKGVREKELEKGDVKRRRVFRGVEMQGDPEEVEGEECGVNRVKGERGFKKRQGEEATGSKKLRWTERRREWERKGLMREVCRKEEMEISRRDSSRKESDCRIKLAPGPQRLLDRRIAA